MLDTYEAERWPVGRKLLQFTDRAFSLIVRSLSPGAFSSWLRRTIPARIIPLALRSKRLRTRAFRFISELDIRYRRSPAVLEGAPRLTHGPRAGDRLPDAVLVRDSHAAYLLDEIAGPRFHLLLCGAVDGWDATALRALIESHADWVSVRYLTTHGSAGDLIDPDGTVLRLLGVRASAQYLVRPDGYIAYRCAGRDLDDVAQFLRLWFPK